MGEQRVREQRLGQVGEETFDQGLVKGNGYWRRGRGCRCFTDTRNPILLGGSRLIFTTQSIRFS